MRLIFTLALTCLFASCAKEYKATTADIIEEPGIKSTGKKPTAVADATTPAPVVRVNQKGGMVLPPVDRTLPDKKEFQATAPVQTTADRGTGVVVPAPKPANE
ncbi:hypothetical protein [Haloferula sp. BvORR071]|uniref:hypothetical protein n=1 Tax=Haloferula sp. BvORR071 TaxID=1396141 RepID=UPI00054FA16D|nr:hypothetical protein [Haloferula sp. BvORR071]